MNTKPNYTLLFYALRFSIPTSVPLLRYLYSTGLYGIRSWQLPKHYLRLYALNFTPVSYRGKSIKLNNTLNYSDTLFFYPMTHFKCMIIYTPKKVITLPLFR